MWTQEYSTNLEFLVSQIRKYLDPQGMEAIYERIGVLKALRIKRFSPWSFILEKDNPLSFKKNRDNLQADISTIIVGIGDDIKEINSLLRIWSFDAAMMYRDGIDGEQIRDRLMNSKKRVMVRFHFDKRADDFAGQEPIYHVHVGGVANPSEICWFPDQLRVPRLHFPPMDPILLCELILVNFFPEDTQFLRKTPEWKRLVIKSQTTFQKDYFSDLNRYASDDSNTVLGKLIYQEL